MILLPKIEVKDGLCVGAGGLGVGRPPVDVAMELARCGAKWVHITDLDGGRNGVRKNFRSIYPILRESGLRVELSGGIHNELDVITVGEGGAARLVIGSAAVSNPALVDYAVGLYQDRVAVRLHCPEGGELDHLELAKQMEGKGVKTLVFTDASANGRSTAPSYEKLAVLQERMSCQIVADGVTTPEEVNRLRDMGLYGAIISMTDSGALAEAMSAAGAQE